MQTYVMAFESTHAAMAAQHALAGAEGFALIPTPTAISAGCGMSLKFCAPTDEAAGVLARTPKEAAGLAALYRKEGVRPATYELIERL